MTGNHSPNKNAGFGQRQNKAVRFDNIAAASSIPDRDGNKFRDDLAREAPKLHNSHFEVHWPKYLAVVAIVFSAVYLVLDKGLDDIFSIIFAATIFGAVTYFVSNRFRNSLNNIHDLRTTKNRSKYYLLGGGVGFGYFVYSNFISPSTILGVETGPAAAFSDGFQASDFGAIAQLLLQGAAYVVIGGLGFEVIAKRLFGSGA